VLADHRLVSVWAKDSPIARSPAFKGALLAAIMIPVVGTEALAAVTHSPHYRLYINALGGGDKNINWFFPHCDYYDAGFREAVAAIAAKAEPGAELSTEIDWSRSTTPPSTGAAISSTRSCAAVRRAKTASSATSSCRPGGTTSSNDEAIENLAKRTPWFVERLQGAEAVKVYRLEGGETPFGEVQATARPIVPSSAN